MRLYRDRVLPHLINLAMRQRELVPYRRRLIAAAEGRVLEIGIGSGLNLPYYGAGASRVIGLDPSPRLLVMARRAASAAPLDLLEGGAECIPLDDRSIDTVVTAWTLCSIPEAARALGEVRRVLRPGGRLLFVEHGRAPEPRVQRWQDALTPAWRRIAGGCHLNRAIDRLVADAGFAIERLDTGYLRRPKVLTFMYEGCARPR